MITFEKKIKLLSDVMEEKDDNISYLEKQLEEMNNKFAEATKIEKIKKKTEFLANTERGLKTHITRLHTASSILETIFPKKCELCEEEIKSKSEMKNHLKNHSYRVVN